MGLRQSASPKSYVESDNLIYSHGDAAFNFGYQKEEDL